jgi:transposase-like protein
MFAISAGLTRTHVRVKLGIYSDFTGCFHVTCPVLEACSLPPVSRSRLSGKPCPHCNSSNTQRHGSFVRKDGTRQPRRRCRDCRRTFNQHTGTPLHYLKKRAQWVQMLRNMGRAVSLRRMAGQLNVHLSTTFRWRHRLLAALSSQPQPVLTGAVSVSEMYMRYSEKGSRHTAGPGAFYRRRPNPNWAPAGQFAATVPGRSTIPFPFRGRIDGKPSCVILACAGDQPALAIGGRGRLGVEQVQACLVRLLGAGAEVWIRGFAPHEEACQALGIPYRSGFDLPVPRFVCGAESLGSGLYRWLIHFRGVATKYLNHYLVWGRLARLAEARRLRRSRAPMRWHRRRRAAA